MSTQRLNDWVQIIAALAIVLGLALVVWELQQSREAVRSQLASDHFQTSSAIDAAVMGEHTAVVLAKACDKPAELTREELHVLEHYYFAYLDQLRRVRILAERGSFYTEDQISEMAYTIDNLLETAPGRAFLRTAPLRDIRPLIDQRLADWNGSSCKAFMDTWADNIRREME